MDRQNERVRAVPTGRVKWYSAEKGFGFVSQEDGDDVYVGSTALPAGVEALKAGQKVEFGIAAGRRGPQALSIKVIEPPPSIQRTRLEDSVQPELRTGRYPDRKTARRVSEVVKAVARELDA